MRRAFAPRVPERVGEDEPAFRIRVDDLDRLAVRRAEDVAGAERVSAGEVLGGREDGDRAHRQPEGRDRADPVQRARAAGHVALHVLHVRRLLEREAAGVEGDRLADETEQEVGPRGLRRVVAEDDQARLAVAAAARRLRARPCRARRSPRGRASGRSGARARRRAAARARRAAPDRARSAACSRDRAHGSSAPRSAPPARRLRGSRDRRSGRGRCARAARRPPSPVFQRPGEYAPRIVPSTSAAACSGSGTGRVSSSSQRIVPPMRSTLCAAAAPAVRRASASTVSRGPIPAATSRGDDSSPFRCRSTASPRSPRSSPLSTSRASRPPSFSSTIRAPSPPSG